MSNCLLLSLLVFLLKSDGIICQASVTLSLSLCLSLSLSVSLYLYLYLSLFLSLYLPLPLSFSLLYSSHSVHHASQSCYTS